MDVGRVLREARRDRGWSQRRLAQESGVGLRTVAAAECGRTPSLPVLEALLAACGLELSTAPLQAPAAPCAHLTPHLRRSLSQRWAAALEGTGRRDDLERALAAAAHHGLLVAEPAAAVAVWVPGVPVSLPLLVRAHRRGARKAVPPLPDPDLLLLRRSPAQEQAGLLRVRTGGVDVHVHAPAALAADSCCRPWRTALQAVAGLLDEQGGRDDAGRRPPPHRQPDEDEEARRLSHSLRYLGAPRPSVADSRALRLEAPASLPQWLADRGLPPLRGRRTRW